LPQTRERRHYIRCPVIVHELLDDTLGVAYQSQLIGRFDRQGALIPNAALRKAA
jgi:hypothetical protein